MTTDTNAVPRLQPGTQDGGSVPYWSQLPAEWQAVVEAVVAVFSGKSDKTEAE